jgi:hypothetical protein
MMERIEELVALVASLAVAIWSTITTVIGGFGFDLFAGNT